jgi:uncharacterized protein (TIGR03086 family)
MADEPSVLERHRRAIAAFDTGVDFAAGDPDLWARPSPCEGWTARDVVKHVTDIHTVMAHRLGEEVEAPKPRGADEVAGLWRASRDAALRALTRPGALDQVIDVPNGGEMAAGRFVNVVTTDVLVHTWDLARAVGADDRLDPELVERAHRAAIPMDELIRSSGMFGPRIEIDDDADPQSKMLTFFGRDPR